MTKAELVEKIYSSSKGDLASKAQAERVLDATVDAIVDALRADQSVTLTGFGTFKVAHRAARKGRNPRTGTEIDIPACDVVKFTPGKLLKDTIK